MTILKKPTDFIRSEQLSSEPTTQLVLVENGHVVVPNAGANDVHANGNASLIYSQAYNALYLDKNGKGADGYSVVATLNPGANIVADDIHFAA